MNLYFDAMKKLSSYTHAKNCTDITDLNDAINEIQEAIILYQKQKKKVPTFFYIRLSKLKNKIAKLKTKSAITMQVNISFDLDTDTIREAIRHCVKYNIKVTKRSITEVIKTSVKRRGLDLISFPEYWGNEDVIINEEHLEKVLFSLKLDFGLTD